MQEFKDISQEQDDSEARVYELGFHIVPSVGDEGLSKEIEAVHAVIAKNGGNIVSEEQPQLTRLAYPLQRDIARKRHTFDTAYFGWVVFEAFPKGAHAVKEAMRHNEHIIRSLMVKTEKDAAPVRHPATAPRFETKPTEFSARPTEKMPAEGAPETPAEPMSTEQMDAEIEKLVV